MTFLDWLVDTEPIDPAPGAALALNAIYDKPHAVTFKTDAGVKLPAQTLRLEYDNTVSEAASDAGLGTERKLIIFGVSGHPTLPDSDIQVGYRFTYRQQEYRVLSVIYTIGEVQATAEVV